MDNLSKNHLSDISNKKLSKVVNRRKVLPDNITIFVDGDVVKYRCIVCDKSFASKTSLSYHRYCSNGTQKPYKCTYCERRFSSKTHLSYHVLEHTGETPFKCLQCEKQFKTKSKLRRHEEIHTEKTKNFTCDICDCKFLSKYSVMIHKEKHTNRSSFQCSICSRIFFHKNSLIYHIKTHSGKSKEWVCEVCGKCYSMKWNLQLHRSTHKRFRPYSCTDCNKSFSQKRYLQRHSVIHKKAIIFECALCDKIFNRKDNLQRHILNSHLEYDNEIVTDAKAKEGNRSIDARKVMIDPPAKPASSIDVTKKSGRESLADSPIRLTSVIKVISKNNEIKTLDYKQIEELSQRQQYVSVITRVQSATDRNDKLLDGRMVVNSDDSSVTESNDQLSNSASFANSDINSANAIISESFLEPSRVNNVDTYNVIPDQVDSRADLIDPAYLIPAYCNLDSSCSLLDLSIRNDLNYYTY